MMLLPLPFNEHVKVTALPLIEYVSISFDFSVWNQPVAHILGKLFLLWEQQVCEIIIPSQKPVDVDCGNKSTLDEVAYVKY